MRKITCAVVDDEPLAVKLIENYIGRTSMLEHVASFTDSIAAVQQLGEIKPDLLFLDIQMPDMDGMSLARILPADTKVVFTTAFKEYALDSYDVAALDFLVKPIRYDKFLRAAQKAVEWFERGKGQEINEKATSVTQPISKDEIFIRNDGVLQRISLDRIILVEGMKDYVRLHIEGERHPITTHLTMKSVEDNLPSERFMRISRSFIISLSHIRSVDRNMCVYIGDTMVKVTDMYRTDFEAFLRSNTLGK